jgi:hypothetical protein
MEKAAKKHYNRKSRICLIRENRLIFIRKIEFRPPALQVFGLVV